MELGAIGENLPLILILLGLTLLTFFLRRRRKPETTHQEIVASLLSETRLNQALLEVFRLRQETKKFMVTSWQRSKTRLGFLDQPLQVALSDAFMIAEDFNQQIEMAKKHRSASYIASLNADRLKELLSRSRQGLEEWLLKHIGQKEPPPPKYPTITDMLFGGRG